MALVLGALFGPHATLAEVRDAESGWLVATAQVRHADLGPHENDPTTWWRSLAAAIAGTGQRHVAAISVAGSHRGLVLMDDAGVVLRPRQAWNAGPADVTRLIRALGAERWARRSGVLPDASMAITRLMWLRRCDPATFARIGTVMLPHDWLTYRLVGRPVTDRGGASLTGLWSPHTGRWIPDVVALLAEGGRVEEWGDRLPEVLEPAERADWLDAPVFEMLGLRGRPVVGPGTGEAMAVALALGLRRGQLGVALAEATTVLAKLGGPIVDPTGAVHSHADATGGHLAVAETAGGATLVETMADLVDLDVADFGRAALGADGRSGDMVVVPSIADRPGAIVTGLTAGSGRADLARATFEGIAAAALRAVVEVAEAGAGWDDDEPLRLTGPPDGLDVHAQIMATLSGRPVRAVAGPLAAAGACIQAAAVLLSASPEDVTRAWSMGDAPATEPQPDPSRVRRRAALAEEHQRQLQAWLREPDR